MSAAGATGEKSATPPQPWLGVGIDLVRVSRIAESLDRFGARFLHRVYTDGEIAHATAAPGRTAERLAERFAAKEATIKALGLVEGGVGWRQIEVVSGASGAWRLALSGAAREAARGAGLSDLMVSFSHAGDYATAVVMGYRKAMG